MKNWLSEKLDKISKFDSYNRPENNKGSLKLDANENFALKKKFILEIALRAAKRYRSEGISIKSIQRDLQAACKIYRYQ